MPSDSKIPVCVGCLPRIAGEADLPSDHLALNKIWNTQRETKKARRTLNHSLSTFICSLNILMISFRVCFRLGSLIPRVARAATAIIFWNDGCSKARMGYRQWVSRWQLDMGINNLPGLSRWGIELLLAGIIHRCKVMAYPRVWPQQSVQLHWFGKGFREGQCSVLLNLQEALSRNCWPCPNAGIMSI